MSNCLVEIEVPTLIIEIEEKLNSIVEVQNDVLIIEIVEECNQIVEIITPGTSDLDITIEEKKICIIEVVKKELIIEFVEQVVINNPAGDVGETLQKDYVANSQINANRVVALRPDGEIEHADKDNVDHQCNVLGIAKNSGAIGAVVTVVKFGTVTGASIGTIAQDFFLGNNGNLTLVAPTSGIFQHIGEQVTATEFNVNLGEQIIR